MEKNPQEEQQGKDPYIKYHSNVLGHHVLYMRNIDLGRHRATSRCSQNRIDIGHKCTQRHRKMTDYTYAEEAKAGITPSLLEDDDLKSGRLE